MPEDQLTQLLQRIRYLERALIISNEEFASKKEDYQRIIDKLKSMVQTGEITTYLGVDSVYYHLLDELKIGKLDVDKSAQEIRDFIV